MLCHTDRVEVAEQLLTAVGLGVAPLVAATNRYGQVCMHATSP